MSAAQPVEAVFFDARDTLGQVDRPGHLVPYRPTTERLLWAMRNLVGVRIGVITNLPRDVSADAGRSMILEAVLAVEPDQAAGNGGTVRIGDFLDPDGLIINHEAGVDKPDPRIYQHAADRLGIPIERTLYCGENLIEVLGARAAGMQAELKPCPPGREFVAEAVKGLTPTATFSGRAFELLLEHEHLLGDRFFECTRRICRWIRALPAGSPVPPELHAAMGLLVYVATNFADAHHLRAEEAIVPLAIARGMDPDAAAWMYDHHDQARAYFTSMEVAWRRLQRDDERDRPLALKSFATIGEEFVELLEVHAQLENDELYPTIGRHFSEADDTLVLDIISQTGPPDPTPYVALVEAMEAALASVPTGPRAPTEPTAPREQEEPTGSATTTAGG